MKNLWALIKRFFGFPPGPSEEQKTEELITMREDRDCHVAAIATACGVSYEKASNALWHWNLPGLLESPILSNPMNVVRAIRALDFQADDRITWQQIADGGLPVGKVIILVHEPSSEIKGTLNQHWVVWLGKDYAGNHLLHWGQSQTLRKYAVGEVFSLFRTGWPNCAILVS